MALKKPELVDATESDTVVDQGRSVHISAQAKVSGTQRARARIKVGGVYVTGDKASAAQLKHAVALSADMLERLGRKIAQPGVQLKAARDIPLFSADPKEPGRFLRKLNGKIERGVLENGAFKVVD